MESGRDGSDRREDPRQPIELKVEYKRLNTFFSDYTKNISRGGTFIKTNRPLDVGTEFVFKLYVPQLEEPLRIHGQVQWVVTESDLAARPDGVDADGGPGMGIRFVYREGDRREDIERTVEKLMVESLGQRLYSRLMAAGGHDEPAGDAVASSLHPDDDR
jgi:type IV pilus assembly protein PilZ